MEGKLLHQYGAICLVFQCQCSTIDYLFWAVSERKIDLFGILMLIKCTFCIHENLLMYTKPLFSIHEREHMYTKPPFSIQLKWFEYISNAEHLFNTWPQRTTHSLPPPFHTSPPSYSGMLVIPLAPLPGSLREGLK